MKKTIPTSENKNQVVDLFPNLSEYPASEDSYNPLEKEADINSEDDKETSIIDSDPSWNRENHM